MNDRARREPPVETEFGKSLKRELSPVGMPVNRCGFMWRKHGPHDNDEAPPDVTWCPGNLEESST